MRGYSMVEDQFKIAMMLTITRFAVPPAIIITKSSLSFRLITFCETTKLLLVAPEVEKVRFELTIFIWNFLYNDVGVVNTHV